MLKRSFVAVGAIAMAAWLPLIGGGEYSAVVDIRPDGSDRARVSVVLPAIDADTAIWVLPAVVPGSYSFDKYYRFCHNLRAYDSVGGELRVSRTEDGQWVLHEARRVRSVRYEMDDTFDDPDKKAYIFPPSGTSWRADTAAVLNWFGIMGYVEGYDKAPYSVEVLFPEAWAGIGALRPERVAGGRDRWRADSYHELADSPVLYCRPDTVSYMEGPTAIRIAVFSPGGAVSSRLLMDIIKPITGAVHKFLGSMPVEEYAFLFYFDNAQSSDLTLRNMWGALEHMQSSLYVLPEMKDSADLHQWVASTAAHEFLHILVPLTLHSEHIADFNFRAPTMSRHLWLYEGVTEYFAYASMAIDTALLSEKEFLKVMREKYEVTASAGYDYSLTDFSENILTDEYKDLYGTIYDRGAVAAMLLDIRLREISGGERGLLELVQELAADYGADNPFDDAEFLSVIEKKEGLEVGEFLWSYMAGAKPLAFNEYLAKVGWRWLDSLESEELSFGVGISIKRTDSTAAVLISSKWLNLFGAFNGDTVMAINGVEVDIDDPEIRPLLRELYRPSKAQPMTIRVRGAGSAERTLEAVPILQKVVQRNVLAGDASATEEQLLLRRRLLRRDQQATTLGIKSRDK